MKEFLGELGLYRELTTDDGSVTLYSEYFDENCHSQGGAKNETLYNYIEGCEIFSRQNHYPIVILEVGLGLGFGPRLVFELLKKQNLGLASSIKIVSTEIDRVLVEYFFQQFNSVFRPENLSVEQNVFLYQEGNFTLEVLVGDARETLLNYGQQKKIKFNAVFQDPFSPRKNPLLWSKQWFQLIRSLCADDVILSTYSAASSMRKALIGSGWRVEKREGFGGKREATRAFLKGTTAPELILSLGRSPSEAYDDITFPQILE